MIETFATTPFGGARLDARQFANRKWVSDRQAALSNGQAGNENGRADKWQLIRALTEARAHFGLSDRSISVLEALASFHQQREIDGSAPVVVFPSNAELSIRTRGMSGATIRRHLAALVGAGLILRRDSPNGKRYCRRNEAGAPEEMFGFDIAPLALMASEIYQKSDEVRTEERARQKLRAEITIYLRDIAKIIQTAFEEARAGDWPALMLRLQGLSGRVARNAEMNSLRDRNRALSELYRDTEALFLNSLSEQEMSANDSDSEHHIQNSKTDLTFENNGKDITTAAVLPRPKTPIGVTLKRVLAACPQIRDYSRRPIETWADLTEAAGIVRSMLGVSPSAWEKARSVMGDAIAAVVISAILERADEIRSSGGYLRSLTQRAENGEFSIIPMLKALE